MKNSPCISVIIPSYNSQQTITDCLSSVLAQSYEGPYEVIVVDSSDDGTDELIRRGFPAVTLIHLDKKTFPGPARNIGVKAANSEYVAFTDTDCIVAYDWLEMILKRMEKDHYDVVGGVIINGTPESVSGSLGHLNEFSLFLPGMKSGEVSGIATANVCYRRDIFDKQRFNETHFAGEDTLFHWTILGRGGTLFIDSGIKVTHLNRRGLKNVLRHQRKIGEGAGIARMLIGKDLFLVRNPILTLSVLPWIRLFRSYKRAFLCDKSLWKRTIPFFPLAFLISFSWCLGFFCSTVNKITFSEENKKNRKKT